MSTTPHTLKALHAAPTDSAFHSSSAHTLRPEHDSLLRITQGSAWVTLPSQRGDHVLHAGQALAVYCGEHVVIEDWHAGGAPLHYALEPSAQHSHAGGTQWNSLRTLSPSYCQAVLAPLADLRSAAALGTNALLRLARGVGALLLGKLLDTATFLIAACAVSTRA
jgi:Protein of unknown function (DUF2917)